VAAVTAATIWLFGPLPRARVAVLRLVVYPFVFVDVLLTTNWVALHRHVPGDLYQPLLVGRLLPLPTPTARMVVALEVALLLAAAVAATGRLPRVAGAAVFLLYLQWMVVAMSYGKVDHDRFAFLVALAVLPTVGRARIDDDTADDGTGWAIRCIQVAVMLTYFLAAFAKLRFGGLEWVNSATLVRAVARRGTVLGDPLLDYPWVLQATQWLLLAFELAAPLLLLRSRVGRAMWAGAVALHAVTFATITIVFLPHVVCLLSFLPLERAARLRGRRRATSGTAAARPASLRARPLPSRSG
jgi:hypothetical protein